MEPNDFRSIDRNAPVSVLVNRSMDHGTALVEHKCQDLAHALNEIDTFTENGDDVIAVKAGGKTIRSEDFGSLRQVAG